MSDTGAMWTELTAYPRSRSHIIFSCIVLTGTRCLVLASCEVAALSSSDLASSALAIVNIIIPRAWCILHLDETSVLGFALNRGTAAIFDARLCLILAWTWASHQISLVLPH